MIEIQNETSNQFAVDHTLLRDAISTTLITLNQPGVSLTLRLVNDDEMISLNKAYRRIPETTDVLSFLQDVIDPETNQRYLGDIVLSVEKAAQQRIENQTTLNEECALLAIHGTLHLLGFDHAESDEKAQMWAYQEMIFENILAHYKEDKA